VDGAVLVGVGEERMHAGGARLEAGVAEEGVEPDEAAAGAAEAARIDASSRSRPSVTRRTTAPWGSTRSHVVLKPPATLLIKKDALNAGASTSASYSPVSHDDLLDLIKRDFVATPIVELRRARRLMRGNGVLPKNSADLEKRADHAASR